MFDFVHITFIDILDVLLVGFLIYEIIRLIRGTTAMSIFYGIIFLYVIWIIVRALNMKLLSLIMGQVLGVGVIALIVIFQQEIRRFLLHIGTKYVSTGRSTLLKRLFGKTNEPGITAEVLEELTGACRKMAETKTGALIVLRHNSSLENIIETGDEIDARINRRLIENIFFKNTPLHDGAMIISQDKILAARCTLPISDNINIPPRFGMRHRAAIGITESTDATAVVVSEETGEISYVSAGELKKMNSITELRLAIENSYK
ncbi:MAG: diadenylate cyclase CdaA [Bacteroidales bacterium]|nr:diadenylate cyclase CdaA [Bacteroidales bacterium]MDD4669438.1 diadenylate cyclase CdaA [Bacteroidales bacterium]